MSKTIAVPRYAGGSSSSAPIDTLPALRVALELLAKHTDLFGPGERVDALIQAALGCFPGASSSGCRKRRYPGPRLRAR
jgi:hypothetical protein